jgi:putative oxidoreductase
MISTLLQTEPDYIYLLLRVIAGIIIFPYGMQKLFGWFDNLGGGVGIAETLKQINAKKISTIVGWLIIIGQSLGSISLLLGCLARVGAAGNFIIFLGALIVHSPDGWAMNWTGKKKGEGIEYFVMLLSILIIILIREADLYLLTFGCLQK